MIIRDRAGSADAKREPPCTDIKRSSEQLHANRSQIHDFHYIVVMTPKCHFTKERDNYMRTANCRIAFP